MNIRRRLSLAALLSAAACGDPQLYIQLQIGDPYRTNITSVAVQIIEPPISAPFTCDDLAFQRVDPMAIAFSRVAQVTTDALTTPINRIDRLASKLFWVDGLNDRSERLVTGCAGLGEISSDTNVEIIAEPVALVSTPAGVSLSTVVNHPLTRAVMIPVKDALGQPLGNVSAGWQVIGVAGEGSHGMVSSDSNGSVNIVPDLPQRPGPFVLDVRVRWAVGEPVLLSGVIAPEVRRAELPGRALDYQTGSIGPGREKGFAALVSDTPGVHVALAFRDSGTGMLRTNTSARILGAPQLGVIDYAGRARDRVIVVGANAWNEIGGDGSVALRPAYSPPAGAVLPARVLSSGPCTFGGAMNEPTVLIQFDGGIAGVYTPEGELVSSFQVGDPSDPVLRNAAIVASGCVSDASGAPLRTTVIDVGGGIGVFAGVPPEMGSGLLVATWLALGRGIAFGPPDMSGKRLMFGTQLSVNDIVVSRATLERSAMSVSLNFEGDDAVPNVPEVTHAGDIDGDGLVDVVSLFQRPGGQQTALWGVLGREHLGRRIAGDVDLGGAALRNPTMMLIDIDGDMLDDVMLAEIPGLGGNSTSVIEIYPMGIP